MQRIMQSDLDIQLGTYVRLLKRMGMDVEGIALINGSKRLGNSFSLVRVDPETGGHGSAPGAYHHFMGWTKREAYDRLTTINNTLSDVLQHMES